MKLEIVGAQKNIEKQDNLALSTASEYDYSRLSESDNNELLIGGVCKTRKKLVKSPSSPFRKKKDSKEYFCYKDPHLSNKKSKIYEVTPGKNTRSSRSKV